MQRRDFLRTVILSASTLAVGSRLRLAASPSAPTGAVDWAALPFENALGKPFQLSESNGRQTFVLDQALRQRSGATETVSIRFSGAVQTRLAEGCYSLRHAEFPDLDLHLIPGTISGDVCFYRATLVRLV